MKPFEREAVRLLAEGRISAEVLARVVRAPVTYEPTGIGYFLTGRDDGLPAERIVLDEPVVLGRAGAVEVGFVVFVEDHALHLECHGWGEAVPADLREREVVISVQAPKASQ